MPRFWSAEIHLDDNEFRVEARPQGFRGSRLLSWCPFRTGDKFAARVKIASRNGSVLERDMRFICRLREPDGAKYYLIDQSLRMSSLPYLTITPTRYLAHRGEYVLDVTLAYNDQPDITNILLDPSTEQFEDCEGVEQVQILRKQFIFGNRRLISLEAASQDFWVLNITLAFAAAVGTFLGVFLVRLLLGS